MNAMRIPTLSPRRARIAALIVTVLVILSLAVALAGLTWRIAGHAGIGPIRLNGPRGGPAAAPDITPATGLAPFGRASVTDASQPTALPLTLKGVFAGGATVNSVAFIAVNNEPAKPFHVGEAVNGATVEAILAERVILRNGGNLEYLAFPDPAQPAGQPGQQGNQPGTRNGQGPQGQGAPAASGNAAPTAGADALLQRLNATPVDGGYRVGANGAPGLMAGDVVSQVNGTALSDPATAAAALRAAQANGSAQVTVVRNGQSMTLTVPLR